MVFSSMTFLFAFFPLVMLLYFLFRNRIWRNSVLLVFSLVFYSWGEPRYIALMLLASLVAYLGGLLICHLADRPGRRKAVFILTVGLLVLNLLVFKYFNFFTDNVSALLGAELAVPEILLPIGISFYTFQILSYVIDLYRGRIGVQKNFFYLTLYVCFFPQLIAGPIVRYQTVEEEILHRHENWDDAAAGLKRFIIGLAKKVILANNIALIGNIVYAGDLEVYGSAMYWVAAIAYALQIYFDFSGYSDMAIGLGLIFGFHFLENFNYPYIAQSITDFWRRWHISLSTWFRDYIYIPLGGNRVTQSRWILNILVVWGLTGFWHGAQWNFLLWGLYYAALLLIEKLFLHRLLEKLPALLRWAYAFFFVLIGWVIFNLTDFARMRDALSMMFSFRGSSWIDIIAADSSILTALLYLPFGIVCMLPIGKYLRKIPGRDSALGTLVLDLGYALLLGLCVMYILSSSFNPFIYFRF